MDRKAQQARLAATHGIEAFCYWHYWFAGRRVLELPFDAVLRSGEPDFPFCLAWANQSWSGVWHGAPLVRSRATTAMVLILEGTPTEDVTIVRFEDTPVRIQEA